MRIAMVVISFLRLLQVVSTLPIKLNIIELVFQSSFLRIFNSIQKHDANIHDSIV